MTWELNFNESYQKQFLNTAEWFVALKQQYANRVIQSALSEFNANKSKQLYITSMIELYGPQELICTLCKYLFKTEYLHSYVKCNYTSTTINK